MLFFVCLIPLFREITRHVQNNTCDVYAKISVREKGAGDRTGTKPYHGFDPSQIKYGSSK